MGRGVFYVQIEVCDKEQTEKRGIGNRILEVLVKIKLELE